MPVYQVQKAKDGKRKNYLASACEAASARKLL
jgi:hypothetical protein